MRPGKHRQIVLPAIACLFSIGIASEPAWVHAEDRGEPWRRHAIDGSSRGADGVRLADVNGDGRPDIATGWEEGGVIRAYLQSRAGARSARPGPP